MLVAATTLVFSFLMAAMPTSLNSLSIPVMTTAAYALQPNLQAGPTCFGMLGTIHGSGWIYGTAGNDVIIGGTGNDHIFSYDGNDRICGQGGDDYISGGAGIDRIRGDSGDDELVGASGPDSLSGGSGTDSADGGAGYDGCVAESEVSCEDYRPAG